QHRAAPFAADADTLDGTQHSERDAAPDSDRIVSGHECDEEGRDTHEHQRCDQRRLATDAVAVMAENRSPDRARGEADEIGAEGQQRCGGRIVVREIKLAEHQSGSGAIEEEIVPFDRGADCGGDHCLAHLAAMVGRGKRAVSGYRTHTLPPSFGPYTGAAGPIPKTENNLRPCRGKRFRYHRDKSCSLQAEPPAM